MKKTYTRWIGAPRALALVATWVLGNPLAWAEQVLPDDEKMCMALNVYHEARGESKKGMHAVAAATLNRVKSPKYPNNICDVVWQPSQFSWTKLPKTLQTPEENESWQESLAVAEKFSKGKGSSNIGDATHYHNNTVRPKWSAKSQLVAQVGRHSFYSL